MMVPLSVNVNDYVHAFDEEARRNLEAIPGFSLAVKTFLKLGYEKMLHGTNMASKIRLSSTQIKDIYELLPPICEELGIVEPELYLEMNPAHFKYTKRELLRRFYSWEQTAGVDKRWLLRLFAYFPLSIPKCRNFSYRLRSVLRSALFQSGKASYSPPR